MPSVQPGSSVSEQKGATEVSEQDFSVESGGWDSHVSLVCARCGATAEAEDRMLDYLTDLALLHDDACSDERPVPVEPELREGDRRIEPGGIGFVLLEYRSGIWFPSGHTASADEAAKWLVQRAVEAMRRG